LAAAAPPKGAQRQCMLAPPENMATIVEAKTSGRANQAATRDLCLPSSSPRLLGAPFCTRARKGSRVFRKRDNILKFIDLDQARF